LPQHVPSFLDWRSKGLPASARPIDPRDVPQAGWNLFDGRFLLPTMVILREALEHDITLMAKYTSDHGVDLAPHGKTTMSPQIWGLQLEAGAWAITVATAWQARVAATVGVPRILIANEIVDEGGLAWLGSALDEQEMEVICQADSVAGVEPMTRLLGARRRQLPVLVEVGLPGGRTGVRSIEEARPVVDAIAASPSLLLAGVTCFEGVAAGATAEEKRSVVLRLLGTVREVAVLVADVALRQGAEEIVVSGGGSVYFTTVVDELTRPLEAKLPVRVVIRSGCTVSHDHGSSDEASPFGSGAAPGTPRLRPALEVWAPVLSTPEPGLALVCAGKRDLPYDTGMPKLIKLRRREASVERVTGISVTGLNDQHAYLTLEPSARLAVGDLVGFGISHPCSAFDRWRSIPVVDEDYGVVDVFETVF
jgi:D-serine deaminase-like pyridoxal phosphate-dependent protein